MGAVSLGRSVPSGNGRGRTTDLASCVPMSRSDSSRFPVTVTRLPVTRCEICGRTVAYRPGQASAVLTEHYRTLELPDRSTWIILVQVVEDPEYLTQPFVVNYHFKKLPDASAWTPEPCSAR